MQHTTRAVACSSADVTPGNASADGGETADGAVSVTDGGAGSGVVQRQETYQAGMTVGSDYLLLSLVGRGGMGAVFEATQDAPRRTVAVKVLAGTLHNSDNAARRATVAAGAGAWRGVCGRRRGGGRLGRQGVADVNDRHEGQR